MTELKELRAQGDLPARDAEPAPVSVPAHQRAVRGLCQVGLGVLGSRSVRGLEHLPSRGPFILAANHLGYFDAPLVFACFPPMRIYAFAARKYRRHWLFGPILRLMDIIWVSQREADREALEQAEGALHAGHILAMAPEGTRSPTGALIAPRPGVAFLATRTGVPIVPCAIEGTQLIKVNAPRLRRTALGVSVGRPFKLAPVAGRGRSQQLEQRTDVIMAHIAALLPESYLGVYKDHVYVQQLARGEGPLMGELPA